MKDFPPLSAVENKVCRVDGQNQRGAAAAGKTQRLQQCAAPSEGASEPSRSESFVIQIWQASQSLGSSRAWLVASVAEGKRESYTEKRKKKKKKKWVSIKVFPCPWAKCFSPLQYYKSSSSLTASLVRPQSSSIGRRLRCSLSGDFEAWSNEWKARAEEGDVQPPTTTDADVYSYIRRPIFFFTQRILAVFAGRRTGLAL